MSSSSENQNHNHNKNEKVVTPANVEQKTWDNPEHFDVRFTEQQMHFLKHAVHEVVKRKHVNENLLEWYLLDEYQNLEEYLLKIIRTRYSIR